MWQGYEFNDPFTSKDPTHKDEGLILRKVPIAWVGISQYTTVHLLSILPTDYVKQCKVSKREQKLTFLINILPEPTIMMPVFFLSKTEEDIRLARI